VRKEADKKGSH